VSLTCRVHPNETVLKAGIEGREAAAAGFRDDLFRAFPDPLRISGEG